MHSSTYRVLEQRKRALQRAAERRANPKPKTPTVDLATHYAIDLDRVIEGVVGYFEDGEGTVKLPNGWSLRFKSDDEFSEGQSCFVRLIEGPTSTPQVLWIGAK